MLLDSRGHIVEANDSALAFFSAPGGLRDERRLLRAAGRDDDRLLRAALARALPGAGVPAGGSLTVGRFPFFPRLVVHLVPVPAPVPPGDSDVALVVLVVDPARGAPLDPALVASAFGLTPAEAAVAVLLASGHTVAEIAVLLGRRDSTLRSHLKQIFAKLGVRRQADVVRLLLSTAAPFWPGR